MSRKIGRGSDVDVYSESFNTMEAHFSSNEGSSYNTSSGPLKYDRKKTEGNIKLHVSNIPLDLTEGGLTNIFSSQGGNPVHAYIGKSKAGGPTTWGFVEFKTLSEAQAAITALNRKPPHNLNVRIARTEEEKQEREKNKNEGRENEFEKSSTMSVARGRGQLAPMQGKPPSTFMSTKPEDDDFFDGPKAKDYSSNQFSHPDSTQEVNASNAVYSRFSDGYYDNGNRKMSMGRGSYINKMEERQEQISSSPFVSRDKFIFEEVTDDMDSKVAAYISKRFRELTCDENYKFTSQMRLSLPFKLGKCACCSRPSIYCCSRCKEWYCCDTCRSLDYSNHKKTCFPRSLIFDKDGNVIVSNEADEFANVEEIPTTMLNHSSNKPTPETKNFNGSTGFQKTPTSGRNSFGFNESNGYDNQNNSMHENQNSEQMNRVGYQKDRNERRSKDSYKDQAGGKGSRSSTDNVERRGDGNKNNRNTGGGGGGRHDKRGGSLGNQNKVNEVFVRPPLISSPESTHKQDKNITSVVHTEQPPIPLGEFSEVTVGHIEGKNGFFAYSKCVYAKQIEIVETLNKFCSDAPPINGRVEIGCKVAAQFNGEWYRGVVKKFFQKEMKAEIFFIDFGNKSFVEKRVLQILPPDLAALPNLAHKYILADSPENPTLVENLPVNIKPIKQDKEGRWVVHAEGVQYQAEEFQELKDGTVLCEGAADSSSLGHSEKLASRHLLFSLNSKNTATLLVEKVMNEDFLTGCIIPVGSTPYFNETSKILEKEVVRTEKIRLKPAMMVAALCNNEWYRGYVMLIRDKDPFVALIDRGRVVVPQAVAPLPKAVKRIPESGVRAIFKNSIKNTNMNEKTLSIVNARVEKDKVYVEVDKLGEAVLVPWEPLIEEAGLNVCKLISGSKVVISSYVSPTAVYLQSTLREDLTKRAELMQDVAAHCLKCEPLKRRPLCGEFLAARFSEDNNYYRAQIFKRNGDQYKVIFVDYGNTEDVAIADMKPLSDSLKIVPCFAVKVGLKGVPDVPFNSDCMKFLNELCANLVELFVKFDGDLRNVTLETCDGVTLNKELALFLTPSWDKPNFDPIADTPFMESDLVYEEWKKGDKIKLTPVRALSHYEILAVSTDSDLLLHIERNLTPSITKYCEKFPKGTYNPRQYEICLAKFDEDGKWYRALCLKNCAHNASEVFYIDYGNSGEVLHRFIRKMVKDFMETPVALKACKVYGLPEKLPDGPKNMFIDFYNKSPNFEAKVIDVQLDTPILWIPALQGLAEEVGLRLKSP